MGAFLFSNNKSLNTSIIEDVFVSQGHKTVKTYRNDKGSLVHASKILTHNKGFLSSSELGGDENDYILGIGTFFYKKYFGDKALKTIWEDLDIILKENSIYGHWAFVVHKNNATYVFNDMTGTLRLYYAQEGNSIIVSSSLTSTIASLSNPRFDKIRLSATIAARFGREVPFIEGIEDVNSSQILYIKDGAEPEWLQRAIPTVRRIDDIDEGIEYVKSLFKEQTEVLKAIGDEKISIELTGGLDSRLVTANLKSSGFNYDFISYPIYGPDQEMAEIISQGLNKKLLQQTNIKLEKDFEKHVGEFDFGANFFIQYPNIRWNIINRLQFSGALGECINTPVSIDWLNDTRTENLLNHLIGGELMGDENRKHFIHYLEDLFNDRGYKKGKALSEQELSKFEGILLGELTGDFRYNSGCQAHIYYYNMYTEWHFNHYVSNIAFDVKNGRKLTLALIKAIDPEVGSYPFLSRLHTRRNSVNEVSELPIKYFSYLKIKKLLPKPLLNLVYKIKGVNYKKMLLNDIDFDVYKDVVNIKQIKTYPNIYMDELNKIYSIEVLRKKFNIVY